jgi:hypothetical protein
MEKNPWYKNVQGPFLQWRGPVGVKEDGGGCTRAQGKVGNMVIHRAACNHDKDGKLVSARSSRETFNTHRMAQTSHLNLESQQSCGLWKLAKM